MTENEVHVWRVALDALSWQALWQYLDAAERGRAVRFRREADQIRYIASHGALRQILARYLGADAAALRFEQGESGKPGLASCSLRFNLSHSGEMALCAVAQAREVGVDVEQIRPRSGLREIAGRFFAPAEHAAIAGPEDFYRIWTRKEALLKAAGIGIAGLEAPLRGPADWHVWELRPREGYAGAVAAEIRGAEPALLEFTF